jgi:L-ascorbate metabolism protein UlaG (beta-lactamase superfamily)
MRIIKHEHARLTIRHAGETLIVDPGSFSPELGELENVAGVVVTHEHADHWTPENLARIVREFPGVPVFGTRAVAASAPVEVAVVTPGDERTAGPFALRFSYAVPDDVDVQVLAAPAGAPWLKIGEAMDYVLAIKPRHAFGTHEMTLSAAGTAMHFARLAWATEQNGGEFHPLAPGDALDI